MFVKAERKRVKLRLAIEGPSGSGKTQSALLIARGLIGPEGKIAVLDTENDSASLYAHITDFDTAPLAPPYEPERYIKALHEAVIAGYDVLVIDSISHEWSGKGGCLEIHSTMTGNSFMNWSKVTPRHDAFVQAILQAPIHIIATMRSKEVYAETENSRGKTTYEKAGEAPQQRQGISYEFTTVLTLNVKHYADGTKDRTGLFEKDHLFIPTVETGKLIRSWLDSGAEDPLAKPYDIAAIQKAMADTKTLEALNGYIKSLSVPSGHRQQEDIADLYRTRKAQIDFIPKPPAGTTPAASKPITEAQRTAIQAHFNGWDRDARLEHLSDFLGHKLESVNDMTCDEASEFLEAVHQDKEAVNA